MAFLPASCIGCKFRTSPCSVSNGDVRGKAVLNAPFPFPLLKEIVIASYRPSYGVVP